MLFRQIADWENAYANMPNIPGGDRYPDLWSGQAAAFREKMAGEKRIRADVAYGDSARARMDVMLPAGDPSGLLMFIHGGYWMRFDNSYFSHLAAGPLERGWAVAMPAYDLCPQVRISTITKQIGKALHAAADMVSGPIRIAGHSAGGHLATRMVCTDSPVDDSVRARIEQVMSISGVHDLRPLLRLAMNETLRLDADEAAAESPALLAPVGGARVICWAGAGERAEFLRNNALLANIWTGLGANTVCVEEPDRHHFDVVEGLMTPHGAITAALLDW